ncbi:S41 family peptidase [Patescibacteria group bacterium]|nr:S41 family peptidase [Patescibacteria group bacterium]
MLNRNSLPKIRLSSVRHFLVTTIVIGGIFSAGYLVGNKGYSAQLDGVTKVTISRDLPSDKQSLDFSLFWRVWDTLQQKYFDKTKLVEAQMVYGAIRGMVAAVGDPYTVFLPPSENKVVQEDLKGSFEGVGIQIGFKGRQLSVISPLSDSPAEKAGVKAGDFIIGIKDEQKGIDRGTAGITLPEAVQAIRGEAGSIVTLTLLRGDSEEPIVVDIKRARLDISSVELSFVGEGENIAHVKILKFSGETLDEWEQVVIEILKNPNIDGIVLDLRNNPGGFLQGSVDLASDFLDNGSLVVTEENADGSREEFKVERIGRLKNRKVVVLVNGGSASASEILAGALRDIKGIPLVGETTFGKGTIQEPQQVGNGAGLHITIARWLTPNDLWVDDGGLVPDHELEDNPDTEEDEQLQKAIEVLGF